MTKIRITYYLNLLNKCSIELLFNITRRLPEPTKVSSLGKLNLAPSAKQLVQVAIILGVESLHT